MAIFWNEQEEVKNFNFPCWLHHWAAQAAARNNCCLILWVTFGVFNLNRKFKAFKEIQDLLELDFESGKMPIKQKLLNIYKI